MRLFYSHLHCKIGVFYSGTKIAVSSRHPACAVLRMQNRNYIAPRVFRCNIICNFALFLRKTCIFCDFPHISTGKKKRVCGRKAKQAARLLVAICTNGVVDIR